MYSFILSRFCQFLKVNIECQKNQKLFCRKFLLKQFLMVMLFRFFLCLSSSLISFYCWLWFNLNVVKFLILFCWCSSCVLDQFGLLLLMVWYLLSMLKLVGSLSVGIFWNRFQKLLQFQFILWLLWIRQFCLVFFVLFSELFLIFRLFSSVMLVGGMLLLWIRQNVVVNLVMLVLMMQVLCCVMFFGGSGWLCMQVFIMFGGGSVFFGWLDQQLLVLFGLCLKVGVVFVLCFGVVGWFMVLFLQEWKQCVLFMLCSGVGYVLICIKDFGFMWCVLFFVRFFMQGVVSM